VNWIPDNSRLSPTENLKSERAKSGQVSLVQFVCHEQTLVTRIFFLRYINELLLHKITTLTFTGTQMLGGRGVKPRLANDGAAPST